MSHAAACTGQEIALQVADVAQHVYHSARTWGDALSEPAPRPNVERLPMVARLGGDGSAHLVGGRALEAIDAIIYCTGYKYRYSFLERTGLLSTGERTGLLGHREACCLHAITANECLNFTHSHNSKLLVEGLEKDCIKAITCLFAEDGRVHPLYKHIFVPSVAPTLALVGLLWKSLRNIQFELQVLASFPQPF